MTTLMQASNQWATRPADERFTSLIEMRNHFRTMRDNSKARTVATKNILALPTSDNKGLLVQGLERYDMPDSYAPTHFAFGQLAGLAKAPAGYLRSLPSPIAADCINYGIRFKRDVDDVGLLSTHTDLRAATGPNYGRIWNSEVTDALVKKFGDGVSGDWKVPGEFGKAVTVTKDNTTLFAGDRDMFVFLADEDHKIEMPNRRNGEPGQLSRGFFVWNSEVGSATFGLASFLFDYVCCNRIVWGAAEYKEIRIRHTASAPDRFLEEIQPALIAYANSSSKSVTEAVEAARAATMDKEAVDEFLASRFGKRMVEPLKVLHKAEENRPIETRWDVVTAATAYARSIPYQDDRVEMERKAGDLLAA